MERADLTELYFITAISTLPSIATHGVLSHIESQAYPHEDLSMVVVQDRRDGRRVPNVHGPGRPLHEYANLYLSARNPMLYLRRERYESICVLRISTDVLDITGAVVADGNASSDYTRFSAAPDGLEAVDRERTFAESWTSDDHYAYLDRKRRKCAEVLVPGRVAPSHIQGIYVACDQARQVCEAIGTGWPITLNRHLFFR